MSRRIGLRVPEVLSGVSRRRMDRLAVRRVTWSRVRCGRAARRWRRLLRFVGLLSGLRPDVLLGRKRVLRRSGRHVGRRVGRLVSGLDARHERLCLLHR